MMSIKGRCFRPVCGVGPWLFRFAQGTGGNVSVLVADRDLMAVTPSSVKYHELGLDDICICDLRGAVVEGVRAPSVEAGLHAAVYRERPDVKAWCTPIRSMAASSAS